MGKSPWLQGHRFPLHLQITPYEPQLSDFSVSLPEMT